MSRKLLLLAGLFAALATPASAQDTGRIVGRVLEAASAKPLAGAQVFVNDGVVGTLSDLNGRFVLSGVPIGAVDVTVQQLGYGTKTVTGVQVLADQVTTLDLTLEETAVEIEGIVVSAVQEQGSSAFLLDQRRTADAMVEAVGAEEIARRPDSDAADVAQRMTGVTVAEGKYVFVRGLGERYSQTSLNGSSLPSPEPEREVVPLDLFPSGFLESLVTQKSYTPDLPADFSGGSVKIQTKDFPNEFKVRLGVGTSYNTISTLQDGFLSYAGGGRDFLGLDDGTRGQPSVVEQYMGGLRSGERLPADPAQRIEVAEAYRNSGLAFAPGQETAPLNRSFDLSVGGRADVGDEGELGFFLAGTYSDNYTIRDDEEERKWIVQAFDPATTNIALPNVDYAFVRGMRAVQWGTIGNIAFKPNPNQKIALKTTVNLSTDSEGRTYQGTNEEDIGAVVRSERDRWVERLMLWGQLSGEHLTVLNSKLDWRLTGAQANRYEPNLRETLYEQDPITEQFFLYDRPTGAVYFSSDLVDDDLSGDFDWRFPFQFGGNEAAVKFGAAYRNRNREFGARRLNWQFAGSVVDDLDTLLETATIVPSGAGIGELSIQETVQEGDVYQADDTRTAGYVMVEFPVTSRLEAIFGARVENYALTLDLVATDERVADLDQTDVIPSVNLTYSVSDDIKIRASASQTLDRPEFRELAPFQFTEATSLRELRGNPDLTPATILSGDLRVDWFPGPGEMISVGGFFKDMQDPIEQVLEGSASTRFSFQNAAEAQVFGLEFDVQLGLARIAEVLRPFSFQGNYSWIDSEVTVRTFDAFVPTNENRPLEGQAPYVLNLGLNYSGPVEAGVFFNRFGDRINTAGGFGLPDIVERPRNSLDATLGFPLPQGVRAKIKASNLMDAPYLFEQSLNGITQVQRRYTVGRTFSVGLSWEF